MRCSRKKESVVAMAAAMAAAGGDELAWKSSVDAGTAAHSRPRLESLHSLAKRPGGYEP